MAVQVQGLKLVCTRELSPNLMPLEKSAKKKQQQKKNTRAPNVIVKLSKPVQLTVLQLLSYYKS